MKDLLSPRGLAVVVVLFLAVHMLASLTLRSVRLDLTENNLYTLTEGSRNILADLEEPITLKLFFSEGMTSDVPILKTYATRVRELLEEFVLESGGGIRLEVIDPEPFTEAEDEAVQSGLRGVPVSAAGDLAYFGLVASNSTDQFGVLPFFDPSNEEFLEYDLAKLVYKLANPDKPVVGVLSALPIDGGPPPMFPGAPPPPPGWFILEQVRETFEVQVLDATVDAIPDDVDVLMIVHPKALSGATLFAIDQFVLGGGKVLAFVDPHSEEDEPPRDPSNPMAGMGAPRASDLGPLLRAWGVELVPEKVVGDLPSALSVTPNTGGRPERVDYVVWLGLGTERLDQEDPVTADLSMLRMAAAGVLRPVPDASTRVTPLITTSADAMEVDVERMQFFPDPKGLLAEYQPGNEAKTLAVRIHGSAQTAYPDGPPGGLDVPGDGDDAEGDEAEASDDFLRSSVTDIHVIVVSDADMLADRWWVQFQNLLGLRIPMPTADNASFAINALDSLAGSTDLISVRSRGRFARPFHVIEELRKEADQRFRAEEQVLNEELQATNRRLDELQSQRPDGSSLIMTADQAAEIETFRDKQVETRKKLRAVRHELGKEIESLQALLKFLNILGVPLLLLGLALARWYRKT